MDRGGFLTAEDREALSRFPAQIDVDALRRYFTLTPADFAAVVDRRYGPAAKLVAGLQIGAVRLLGSDLAMPRKDTQSSVRCAARSPPARIR